MSPVIILIHGFLENALMWNPVLPAFQHFEHKFIPDLPGHGKNTTAFSPSLKVVAAHLLEDVLKQYPQEEFIIVGHSMGGYIAAEIAFAIPHRIKGLCFYQSTAQQDSDEKKANRARAIEALAANKELYVGTMIRSLFANLENPEIQALTSELIKSANTLKSSDIHNCLVAMRDRADFTQVVRQAPFPVAYLLGDRDSRLPMTEMMPEIEGASHISSRVIQDCGHMSQWENPNEAMDFLKAWLDILPKS